MNVPLSTESMDSTMSVREDTTSSYGRLLQTVLTVCQLLLLLMNRSSVCMVDYLQI